jgi:aminoglycoside 6'-N-acetyltransferase I
VPTEPFSIRIAQLADADQIASISLAVRGVAGADSREAMADAHRLVVVAEVHTTVVGWAKTHQYIEAAGLAPPGDYLGGVSVLPQFRRRGIGLALTRARVNWISERSTEAWFFTNARNVASIALHEQLGFIEFARAAEIHGVHFEGSVGILYRSAL